MLETSLTTKLGFSSFSAETGIRTMRSPTSTSLSSLNLTSFSETTTGYAEFSVSNQSEPSVNSRVTSS